MTQFFTSAEDELNFILGTDSDKLFDIDDGLHYVEGDVKLAPDAEPECALTFKATPTATAAILDTVDVYGAKGSGESLARTTSIPCISRMVTGSPSLSPALDEPAMHGLEDLNNPFNEKLFMGDPEPLKNFTVDDFDDNFKLDLNLDLTNDIFAPNSATTNGPAAAFFDLRRKLGLSHFHPSPFMPIVHHGNGDHVVPSTPLMRNAPLRKRKYERFNPVSPDPPTSVRPLPNLVSPPMPSLACFETLPCSTAAEARRARKNRRSRRARVQAINIVGGGDVAEIERVAVLDSDYSRLSPQALSDDLARNFDSKLFVDLTWEHVYQTLIETSHVKEALADLNLPLDSDCSSSLPPVEVMSNPSTILPAAFPDQVEVPSVVDTSGRDMKNENLKSTLPPGKDAESRKLRRLMRNRLSAQASRDRRNKAIKEMQKKKAEKEAEIALLQKTVSEELQHMMQLEKAVGMAKDYLGADQNARAVAAQPSMVQSS